MKFFGLHHHHMAEWLMSEAEVGRTGCLQSGETDVLEYRQQC